VGGLLWACIGLSTLPLTQTLFSLIQGFSFEQGFKEATQCCRLIFLSSFLFTYMGHGRSGSVGASFHICNIVR